MTRKPTSTEWERYAELLALGIINDDDDLEFTLGVIRRYDPSKNSSLVAFYRWCRSRSKACYETNGTVQLAGNQDVPVHGFRDSAPVDAAVDAATVCETVGQAGYAVLRLRYGDGLSVAQTAKRLGMSRESVDWVEKEALARASSLNGDD